MCRFTVIEDVPFKICSKIPGVQVHHFEPPRLRLCSPQLSYRCTTRLHLSTYYLHVLAESPYSPVSILLQDTYTTRFVNIIEFVYYGRKYQFTVGPFGLNISNTASGHALESVLNVSLLDCEDKMNDLMMNVYIYVYDLLVSSSSFRRTSSTPPYSIRENRHI